MTTTLVIDNYDSFTFNLVHLIEQVNGRAPIVVKNDQVSWAQLQQLAFDNVVLSPGPGRPDRAADFGVCAEVLQHCDKPILGVCLGFQGAGWWAGAQVVAAPEPMHGKTSWIAHTGEGLFAGLPTRLQVARYHSLMLARPLPDSLQETAWSEDGVLMAFAHRSRPLWGVQFHPESILSQAGAQMLENFRRLTLSQDTKEASSSSQRPSRWQAFWCEIPEKLNPSNVFETFSGHSVSAFWLDGQCERAGDEAWTYLGIGVGPWQQTLHYEVTQNQLHIQTQTASTARTQDVLMYLQSQLQQSLEAPMLTPPPCPFQGGWVGWLGYEYRPQGLFPSPHRASTPDAWWMFADRFMAFDHRQGQCYLIALDDPAQHARAQAWLAQMQNEIKDQASFLSSSVQTIPTPISSQSSLKFEAHRDQATYEAAVGRCQDWLAQGESYQLCLTNEMRCQSDIDPWSLYLHLRQRNPAPYAAFLRWPQGAVLSASPESFLKISASGQIESRPIKGTIARLPDAQADQAQVNVLRNSRKDAAENVMIVDLLRNDLSRVCVAGSVTVPRLRQVESFQTVHQLVSTVRGQLAPSQTVIDAIQATFPGGSMTGAPKARSLQLLDTLEDRARGIYSGALGWIGLNGAAELSIVIRTIVAQNGSLRFGVGGGVVMDSTPQGEYAEMQLKAQASIAAIQVAHHPEKFVQPMTALGALVWHDGGVRPREQVSLSLTDRGLTLADGLFETILIEAGQPVWWDAHWARLAAGAHLLQIDLPYAESEIKAALTQLMTKTQMPERCVLRLTVTRGPATYRGLWNPKETAHPTVLMTLNPWAAMPAQDLIIARRTRRNDQSPLSAIKSLAYGDQLLARQEALAAGASEAILLDTQARVSCTSVGNLFVEYKGYWCTPALNCGVLPGVARAHILNQLQAQEMVLRESDLAHVSRAFISNSLGLTPVTRIQGLELCRDLPPEVRSSGRSLFA